MPVRSGLIYREKAIAQATPLKFLELLKSQNVSEVFTDLSFRVTFLIPNGQESAEKCLEPLSLSVPSLCPLALTLHVKSSTS